VLALATLLAACPSPEAEGWTEAFDASDAGWLLSVWGPSTEVLYAVGGVPEDGVLDGHAVIMRRDGETWAPVDTGLDLPLMNWVFGFSADDVFLVGNRGTIVHWDGGAWTIQETPTDDQLWGVWGAAPDDVYAVGGSGRRGSEAVLLHYDGVSWSDVDFGELDRETRALFKVWGSGPDDVVVVGQRGVVIRWDGSEWTQHLVGTTEDLISVWGTGPDRVGIVGGRSNGVLVTWDGSEWHNEPLSPIPGLNGIWMRDPDVIHAVGIEGTILTIDFMSRVPMEFPQDTRLAYHAIFGDPGGRLTSVGGNFASVTGPYLGIASTRDLADDE